MRVLVDTNILVSAVLNEGGTPAKALVRAFCPPNEAMVCEQSLLEFRQVVGDKFPHRREQMETFLARAIKAFEVVPIPAGESALEAQIRDAEDRPILRAALAARADVILTGDRDFLEAGLTCPVAMNPAAFLGLSPR